MIISIRQFFVFLILFSEFHNSYANELELKKYSTKDFLIKSIETGCMPKGMKVDPVGNFLYVAEMCGKIDPSTKKRVPSVSVFDLDKKTLSKTIITPIGEKHNGIYANTEVAFSIDKLWGLITRSEGDEQSEIFKNFGLLTVVNSDTQKIVKYIPLNGSGSKIIAARPFLNNDFNFQQIIYVANYFSDNISIIDITQLKENGNLDGSNHYLGLIKLHTNFGNPRSKNYLIAPRGIAFSKDGKFAFILASETGSLIIVDAVKHQQIAELAPINPLTAGRELNLRHIVISKNGETAYLSHMRGNAISRINLRLLNQKISQLQKLGLNITLPASLWDELLIPFKTSLGLKKVLVLEDYPKDHPNFPGKKWPYSHPNTIVLDPIKNRYLFVSHRTTTNSDDSKINPKIMGKIDIIDLVKDTIVISLTGGAQPTALDVTYDSNLLMSAGLINDRLYFYDFKKILTLYEAGLDADTPR